MKLHMTNKSNFRKTDSITDVTNMFWLKKKKKKNRIKVKSRFQSEGFKMEGSIFYAFEA